MKKIILLLICMFGVILLSAQGIYQMWGMTSTGGIQNTGVIFTTDAAGNNFKLRHQFISNNDGINPFGSLIQVGGKL